MDEEIERKLFERWYKEKCGLPPTMTFPRNQTGQYLDYEIAVIWSGWKARAEMT